MWKMKALLNLLPAIITTSVVSCTFLYPPSLCISLHVSVLFG